jgi:UDP-glucose 4-epimerase
LTEYVTLVTGGGGFIGHHLVSELSKKRRVLVLDNFKRGGASRLDNYASDVVVRECDITDYNQAKKCIADFQIDRIFHLAAINGTGNFYRIPVEVLDVGVLGCYNILKISAARNVRSLVIASSAEVYQSPEIIPTPEDIPLIVPDIHNPRFSYGLSKIYTEYYSFYFAKKHDLNVSIFRPHNVYGPDMGLQHVIPQLLIQFLKNGSSREKITIELKGSDTAQRAFCYVDDIVMGMKLLEEKNVGANVYNLGNRDVVTIGNLLGRIAAFFEKDYETMRSEDQHVGGTNLRCPDLSKVESMGYKCKVDLDNGLKQTIEWYSENYDNLLKIQNPSY